MKRALKWLGITVAVLALAVVAGVGGLYLLGQQKLDKVWDVPARAIQLPAGPQGVAEGQRLFATRGCTECHGPAGAGMLVEEDELFGTLAGPNLTPGGPLAKQDDAQVARAIRHALNAQGRPLVGMPGEYATLSDGDVGAMVAYLRSLAPVTEQPPALKLTAAARIFLALGMFPLAAEEIDHPAAIAAAAATPAPGPTATYGAYLARVQCSNCHGPQLNGRAPAGKAQAEPMPTNLTPHATGLADWTPEQFELAVRQGKRPDGSVLSEGMPWRAYAQLSDDEIKALWAYLREVPAQAPLAP